MTVLMGNPEACTDFLLSQGYILIRKSILLTDIRIANSRYSDKVEKNAIFVIPYRKSKFRVTSKDVDVRRIDGAGEWNGIMPVTFRVKIERIAQREIISAAVKQTFFLCHCTILPTSPWSEC